MHAPSRRQRERLFRELKQFAFSESPQFERDEIQRMAVERSFEYVDTWPTSGAATEQLPSDETIINIGFRATRIHMGDGQKPCYEFLAWGRASRTLPPRELQLSEYKWKELWGQYIEEIDEAYYDEYWQAVDDPESEVIEALIDDEAACEQYASAEYRYNSAEAVIGMNHDFGYAVDGMVVESIETHPEHTRYQLPIPYREQLDSGEQIENELAFGQLTKDLQEVNDMFGDIMPHDEKARELLFLIECLRQRRSA